MVLIKGWSLLWGRLGALWPKPQQMCCFCSALPTGSCSAFRAAWTFQRHNAWVKAHPANKAHGEDSAPRDSRGKRNHVWNKIYYFCCSAVNQQWETSLVSPGTMAWSDLCALAHAYRRVPSKTKSMCWLNTVSHCNSCHVWRSDESSGCCDGTFAACLSHRDTFEMHMSAEGKRATCRTTHACVCLCPCHGKILCLPVWDLCVFVVLVYTRGPMWSMAAGKSLNMVGTKGEECSTILVGVMVWVLIQTVSTPKPQLQTEEGRCSRSILSPGVRNDPLLASFFTFLHNSGPLSGWWSSGYCYILCRCLLFFGVMLQTSCMKPAITAAQGCIFQLSFDKNPQHNGNFPGSHVPMVCGWWVVFWVQ